MLLLNKVEYYIFNNMSCGLQHILYNLLTDGGKGVSLARRLPLHPRKIHCTKFLLFLNQFTPTILGTLEPTNLTVNDFFFFVNPLLFASCTNTFSK
jgi:hypothetical protein